MKLYYTTEEVAQHFDIAPSKVRYYTSEFRLKVKKLANKSSYTTSDIESVGEIIHLLEEEKYTLEGAKIKLKNRSSLKRRDEAILVRLKGIKEILVKLKAGLNA